MKKWLLIYIVLCFSDCTTVVNANTEQVKKLQDEIKALSEQISELQKTITSQKHEIKKLKALCQENGIDLSPKKKPNKPTQSALNQPMFGIFLGETIDSLRNRLVVSARGVPFGEEGVPQMVWAVQCDNPIVKQLLVITYRQQVLGFIVSFIDTSKENYIAIKKQLEKKYKSEGKSGLCGATFGDCVFELVIDGIEVHINLSHISLMGKGKLKLSYTHVGIFKKASDEATIQKANKVKDEL